MNADRVAAADPERGERRGPAAHRRGVLGPACLEVRVLEPQRRPGRRTRRRSSGTPRTASRPGVPAGGWGARLSLPTPSRPNLPFGAGDERSNHPTGHLTRNATRRELRRYREALPPEAALSTRDEDQCARDGRARREERTNVDLLHIRPQGACAVPRSTQPRGELHRAEGDDPDLAAPTDGPHDHPPRRPHRSVLRCEGSAPPTPRPRYPPAARPACAPAPTAAPHARHRRHPDEREREYFFLAEDFLVVAHA